MLTYRESRHFGSATVSLVSEIAERRLAIAHYAGRRTRMTTSARSRVEATRDLLSITSRIKQRAKHFCNVDSAPRRIIRRHEFCL
ncbi:MULTISPECIES: hypothetical protein [unclassified Bradyrhizobium]|uniref:hypothetical protein n=1 Tax=unclassified Bradyrhizobium TaxID=2631580 RepID=UPI0015C7B249|nr:MULTISPECIES: hypothetical protein [unclassified Bradyrhizobium]MBB4259332.1 hypothetical protein [Bradyrhizobium sp. CIR3A]MBB4394493.1 hypothetical protein [Bradyrhizobium sp. ERR14]NYG44047.1 hypothetical protein [Bradyrhizobium sp. IAR9]